MTVDYIGDELPPKVIRVTKGCDRKFTVTRKDVDGNPVDWDSTVWLRVNLATPELIQATVTGPTAVIRIESPICDQVKASTLWQLASSVAETPPESFDFPLAVGYFERQDGKPS